MSVDYVTVYLPTTKGSEMTTLAEDYNTRTNLSTNLHEIFDTALDVKELWERNVSTNKWDLDALEILLCVGGPTQTLLIRHEFTTLTTYWGGDTHEIVTTTSADWSAELWAIESSMDGL